jgi:DNA-directed RNA polymerase subunit RPC12/RpoP
VSQAAGAGGYYCEVCGTTMPFAENVSRIRMPQITALYEENSPVRCNNCRSQAGIYLDRCLRCGKLQGLQPQQQPTF